MKSIFKITLTVASMAFGGLAIAGEYRGELLSISARFDDPNPEIQYEARRSLELLVAEATAPEVERGQAKVNGDLLYCLRNRKVSREAKKYLLRQLALVGSSQAVGPLNKLFLSDDPLLSENARKALESIEGSKAGAALRRAFGKLDESGKKDLLRSMAKRSDSLSVAFVGKQMEGDNASLAVEAAVALGRAGGDQALQLLTGAYQDGVSGELASAVERSLLECGNLDTSLLQSLFEGGSTVSIRRAALSRLIGRGSEASGPSLEAALADEDANARAIGIRAALTSGDAEARDLIVERSTEMPDEDLAIVLSGLDNIDPAVAERIAIRAFDRGNEILMGLALEELGRSGSALSVDLLLSAYGKKEKALRTKAASSIAQLNSDEMDRRLVSMLESGDADKAATALELLAYRAVPGAKDLIIGLVAGDDPDMAKAALRTLTSIGSESDLERLLALSEQKEGEPRRLILAVIKRLAPIVGSDSLQARVEAL